MDRRLNCFSPAKINLFLHVVGKRDDGYHNLQTIFHFLDYGDDMTFVVNYAGKIERNYDYGFTEEVDLNLRAANLLRDHVGNHRLGVSIGLTKRLPQGGGLGGGSSNAAATLKALNKLWGLGLKQSELQELGLQLGADVPVFIYGKSAWAEGVGERLCEVEVPELWYLVLFPDVQVSTVEIFSNNHLTPTAQMKKIRALRRDQILSFGNNDLQAVACKRYPQVASLIDWMKQYGQVRMSGSGGAVFMPCSSKSFAEQILAKRPTATNGFVAKGLNCL